MEIALSFILIIMLDGALYALYAKDLLSAVVSYGIVGFALVIAFLLLQAPDLAIVQVVVETISLVIMISVLIISTREDLQEIPVAKIKGASYIHLRYMVYVATALVITGIFLYFFVVSTSMFPGFGEHQTRMATEYIQHGAEKTGAINLVTGIVFDFRGYDTLGEATVLFTAVIGVLAMLRLTGKKEEL